MSLLGDISDPVKDVAALKPLAKELLATLVAAIKEEGTLANSLDGLTITVTCSRKQDAPKE